jgi:hypothetical protein
MVSRPHHNIFPLQHRRSSSPLVKVPAQNIVQAFSEPQGKLYLVYGDGAIFSLSLGLAAHALHLGGTIAVVDGCNQFDVHSLVTYARAHGLRPDVFLERIFVSRGFTCYQMEAAIVNKLGPFLHTIGSRTAMIFGLLDTFYDEQASTREVNQMLRRVLDSLRARKKEGTSVLLACREMKVMPEARNKLLDVLKTGMDRVYRVEQSPEGPLRLTLERRRDHVLSTRTAGAFHAERSTPKRS